jgi:glycosyltransferase involved in cell wall biosynthesis
MKAKAKSMKIVHVAEAFAGGIPVFIKSLIDNMPDDQHIIIHGNRTTVMSADKIKKQFTHKNVKFIYWSAAQRSIHPYKDIAAFIQLYNALRRLKKKNMLDIVHLHSSKSGFLGRVVCKGLGIKNVIYTPNGAPFMVGENKVSNMAYKYLEKLGNKFGGQVVCCSLSEQVAYEKAGIKSICINNGIATNEEGFPVFPYKKPVLRKNTFRVVTNGRIVHQKNPELFNKIASYFQELSAFEFVWVGDGAKRNLLTAPNITVTGWLSNGDVNDLIKEGDVYLSTANFEGLSFATLEALALQKPVLLNDCIGNKDIVNQGLNGDLFSNENDAIVKILRYYNNRPMLQAMGKHSSAHCRDSFDAKETAQHYHRLYENKLITDLNFGNANIQYQQKLSL